MAFLPDPVDSLDVILKKPSRWDRIRALSVLLDTVFKRVYPDYGRSGRDAPLSQLLKYHRKEHDLIRVLEPGEAKIVVNVRNYASHPERFASRVPTELNIVVAEQLMIDAINTLTHIHQLDELKGLVHAISDEPSDSSPAWRGIENKYPVGSRHAARVGYFTQEAVFVQLERDVVGRVHASEIDWKERWFPFRDRLTIGCELQVQVMRVDESQRLVHLSIKRLLPNPWEQVAQKHAGHDVVGATVVRVGDTFAFVEIDGLEGRLQFDQMSPVQQSAFRTVKPGDKIDVKIMEVNYNVPMFELIAPEKS